MGNDVHFDLDNPGNDLSVLVGTNDLYVGGQRKMIERVFVHPSYMHKYVTYADVALVKLKQSIEFNENIMPACLPFNNESSYFDCYVTGWGYTGPLSDHRTQELPGLREAPLPLLDFKKCQKLGNNYKEKLQMKSHLCAGDPITAKRDACRGDSGGPLSCYSTNNKRWYVSGVTSFSFKVCGSPGHVGIYARVTSYTDWIRRVVHTDANDLC